ncbi:hypothetical protein D9M73_178980 [compost metagenome]
MLAGRVVLRHLEGDLLRLGRQCFFEENPKFHFHVLPSTSGAATRLSTTKAWPTVAEYRTEKVREIARVLAATAETATALPARWSLEWLAMLAITAQIVVFGALVGAFQRFIGFRGVLELGLGVLFLADIGVVFARQLAIGGLDRLVVCGRLHTENLVIVFEVHRGNHHPLSNRATGHSMRLFAAVGLTDLKCVTGRRGRSLSAAGGASCEHSRGCPVDAG